MLARQVRLWLIKIFAVTEFLCWFCTFLLSRFCKLLSCILIYCWFIVEGMDNSTKAQLLRKHQTFSMKFCSCNILMRYIFKENVSYVIALTVKEQTGWFLLGLFKHSQQWAGVNLHFSVKWYLEDCTNSSFSELVVFKRLETVRTDASFDYSFRCVCLLIALSLTAFPCNLFKSRITPSVYMTATHLLIFSCLFIRGFLQTGSA